MHKAITSPTRFRVAVRPDRRSTDDLGVVLDSTRPEILELGLRDRKRGAEFRVLVRRRKMGEDNGKDQYINVSAYLTGIRDWMRHVSRKPSSEERKKLYEILGTEW
jgi:hypothetical protein